MEDQNQSPVSRKELVEFLMAQPEPSVAMISRIMQTIPAEEFAMAAEYTSMCRKAKARRGPKAKEEDTIAVEA